MNPRLPTPMLRRRLAWQPRGERGERGHPGRIAGAVTGEQERGTVHGITRHRWRAPGHVRSSRRRPVLRRLVRGRSPVAALSSACVERSGRHCRAAFSDTRWSRPQPAGPQRVLRLGRADESDRQSDDEGGLDVPDEDLLQRRRRAADHPDGAGTYLTERQPDRGSGPGDVRGAGEPLGQRLLILQTTGQLVIPAATISTSATTAAPPASASTAAVSASSSQTRSVA